MSGNRIRKDKMVVFCCDVYSDERGKADNSIFFLEGNLKEKNNKVISINIPFFLGKIAAIVNK